MTLSASPSIPFRSRGALLALSAALLAAGCSLAPESPAALALPRLSVAGEASGGGPWHVAGGNGEAGMQSLMQVEGAGAESGAPGATPTEEPPVSLPMPVMLGPLAANPHPARLDAGEWGPIYVTGALSGLGMLQTNEGPGDEGSQLDLSNAQVFVQKPEGELQFFAQAGAYSLPALGTTYVRSSDAADAFYGTLPTAYVKFAPDSPFSIMAGKLPTLIGAEYTFTFENLNVERGLLWNQENAINRGVQANYADGPVALALSLNDGFYSDEYTWLTGSATYTLECGDSVSLYGGGNTDEDSTSTLATPLAQNNSRIWGLIYTHVDGPWTMTPYLQYTDVPQNSSIGIADDASTLGGAMLVRYAFDEHFSLAGRVEYIDSEGDAASPNLLYGPDSNAWSLTVTPTWQYGRFFVRPEASYVQAGDTTAGSALGSDLDEDSQLRVLVEAGLLF